MYSPPFCCPICNWWEWITWLLLSKQNRSLPLRAEMENTSVDRWFQIWALLGIQSKYLFWFRSTGHFLGRLYECTSVSLIFAWGIRCRHAQCPMGVTDVFIYPKSRGGSRIFERGGSISGADTGFPEGGGEDIHKHPPLGHCPRDVIHPPKNWKTPPLLDIHKHPPPPLDIARVTVIGPGHAHFA